MKRMIGCAGLALAAMTATAQARVTRIEITRHGAVRGRPAVRRDRRL